MYRNEIPLQVLFLILTASLLALFAARLYPNKLFSHPKNVSVQIVRPIPEPTPELTLNESINPPTLIEIPSLSLSLPIAPGVIANNEWTLFDDKVSWLSTSGVPGEGNVILYAHNRNHLFGGLRLLKIGSPIIVEQGPKLYTYRVTEKRKVSPTDVESVLSDSDQITLYTCDGTFDQKRLVVIAVLDIPAN